MMNKPLYRATLCTGALAALLTGCGGSAASAREVTYTVTGSGEMVQYVDISYANAAGGESQEDSVKLPFTRSVRLQPGAQVSLSAASSTGNSSNSAKAVTCAITVDGSSLATSTGRGHLYIDRVEPSNCFTSGLAPK